MTKFWLQILYYGESFLQKKENSTAKIKNQQKLSLIINLFKIKKIMMMSLMIKVMMNKTI
jgi:hypothetical protein